MVGLVVSEAEDEAAAWPLDVILDQRLNSEAADLGAVGEVDNHEQVGHAVDVLMELGEVEGIEFVDQPGRHRHFPRVLPQGLDHPGHAFSRNDLRPVEELNRVEAGCPLAKKSLDLLLESITLVGKRPLQQLGPSCEQLRSLCDHIFVYAVHDPQGLSVVFLLLAQTAVEAVNVRFCNGQSSLQILAFLCFPLKLLVQSGYFSSLFPDFFL